ncbi:TPA: LOW QUALITY PROTEIN: hypothetical protein N0F65_008201 [Lagenidium giganteum]|uniref:Leucine-rich repeat domain-containing protein n=1 Tax=Lagenidium giganteum TaxID=4803 RepID=A0AAV2YZD7_9STRA|nr:TPA: LOW QUALITY PROTEIN: hypothetical protein N0F65_008201 [Lagenidium giganteum]
MLPYLTYFADLLAPEPQRHFKVVGDVFGCVGALHLVEATRTLLSMLQMVHNAATIARMVRSRRDLFVAHSSGSPLQHAQCATLDQPIVRLAGCAQLLVHTALPVVLSAVTRAGAGALSRRVDMLSNVGTSVVIPVIVFVPYFQTYGPEQYTFNRVLVYDDVWCSIIPHLSIYLCLGIIQVSIEESDQAQTIESSSCTHIRVPAIAVHVAEQTIKLVGKQDFKLNAAHGLFLPTQRWFSSKFPCTVLQFNCYTTALTAVRACVGVVFSHSPALAMPSDLQTFPNLLGVELYNCTLVAWSKEADLSASVHTRMIYLVLARVNMSALPAGILEPLPEMLTDIEISVSNLTALLRDQPERWPTLSVFYFEFSQVSVFPVELLRMDMYDLSLIGNHLTALPSFEDVKRAFYRCFLNPLESLPATGTAVTSLPSWMNDTVDEMVYVSNSPLCDGDTPTAHTYWYVAHPYMKYYSDLLMTDSSNALHTIGFVFGLVGAAHWYKVARMVFYSIRYCELCYGTPPRLHRRLHRSKTPRTRTQAMLRSVLRQIERLWTAVLGRRGLFGVESPYFDARFLVHKVIQIASQTVFAPRLSGFVVRLISHLSIFTCIGGVVALVERHDARAVSDRTTGLESWAVVRVTAAHEAIIRRRTERMTKHRTARHHDALMRYIFVIWGVGVCIIHGMAMRYSQLETVVGCRHSMQPWFGDKVACSVYEFNCVAWGVSSPQSDTFAFLDDSTVAVVAFSHCPALVMPGQLRTFSNLLGVDIYNCTISKWDSDASLTAGVQTHLVYVTMARVNMTEVPIGLTQSLPTSLTDLEIHVSNLSSIPDSVTDQWRSLSVLYLEHMQLSTFPAALRHLSLNELSLMSNNISELPRCDQLRNLSLQVNMAGNPLVTVPRTVGTATKLAFFIIADTHVASLPDTVFEQVTDAIVAMGTPLCAVANDSNALPDGLMCEPMVDVGSTFPIELVDARKAIKQ